MATVGVKAAYNRGYNDFMGNTYDEPPETYTEIEKENWFYGFKEAALRNAEFDESILEDEEYNGHDM